THNKSFVAKPKKKYISKLDMISTLDITNEMYTLCMSSMRICADYHLDYNLSYKDIHKNILFKIIEKFKIKTKDLNISLGYNDWFAYELLKKHVQHVRDHKAKTINGYFTKRTRSRGEERPVEKNVEESEAAAEIEIRDDSDSKEAAAEIEIRDDSDSDIDEDLERQLLNLFRKRYKKTGGTDSSKDEELERNLIREIR
ncbi:16252_t:CDS:2, partial [Rhizophagus irregularis]